MILILTAREDVHANAVERELSARGADFLRFDPGDVPASATMSVAFDDRGLTNLQVRTPSGVVDLSRLGAIWFRRPSRPAAPAHLQGTTAATFVEDETAYALTGLWELVPAQCVPAPRPVVQRLQNKAPQLQRAAELGFELPPTLVTNDPDEFVDFLLRHGNRVVTKQIGMAELVSTPDGDGVARYTEPLRHRDVVHANAMRHCPIIVQAYVPKHIELRVTIVGEQLFAAAIWSQESNHTRHDWRRYDDARTRIEPYELPPEIAARCLALVRTMGLSYGAIDLVLTPDGRYVFIEINPSGQYLWVEDATGLPISAAVAELLISYDVAATSCALEGALT